MANESPPQELPRLIAMSDEEEQSQTLPLFWSFIERSDGAVFYSKRTYVLDHVLDNLEEFRFDHQVLGGYTFTKQAILERSVGPLDNEPVLCWFGFQGHHRYDAYVSTTRPDFI